MYHDLIIHPSRLELVERVFSPGSSSFREKKLTSSDLDFKIDTSVIESGKHYESLRSTLKNLLEPFIKDLSVLNIVVLPAYVQFKVLKSGPEYTDLDDYINWEASKIATDIPDHYRYGIHYDSSSENLIIALIRKNVSDFFSNLMKDIYIEGIEFKIGCRYSFYGERSEFIHTDRTIRKITSYGNQIEAPQSVSKKSVFISVSFLLMVLILSVFYYLNPVQFKTTTGYWVNYLVEKIPYKVSIERRTPSADKVPVEQIQDETITEEVTEPVTDTAESEVASEASAEITQLNTEPETVTEAETVKTIEKTPEFWEFVSALSQLESDSVVFINNAELSIHTKDAEILSNAKELDTENIYNCEIIEGYALFSHSSFSFPNSRLRSNYNKFVKVKDSFNIKPIRYYQNIFKIKPVSKFYEFLDSLKENGVEFRKFIISPNDDYVMFTVYFG